jgi:hypothetical protein
MADKVLIEFQIVQKGKKISVVQKETEKLAKSTEKSEKATKKHTRTTDKYNRVAKGAAGISSNQTKNFSKMQQSVDGGGGSGGLVRAYALLAANVFALTAAFGVLSRSAQVDTLTASIERLEIVSGKSIKSVARDLQEASGFSLDFASSLRSTSLALSAGFDGGSIKELGEVAKNAAVSLGRPLSDALDRIFRGVIKVEPELLDEIGLFVRVDEAASKFADSIGVATTDLTEFQKRQAFANEAIEQGTRKFEAFSDVDPDAFAKLGASFFDLAQAGLSLVNKILVPIIQYLEENKGLLIGLFSAIGLSIFKSIIPAMGQFRQSARNAAVTARQEFSDFKDELKENASVQKENAIAAKKLEVAEKNRAVSSAKAASAKTRQYQSDAAGLKTANEQLAKATTLQDKSIATGAKINALEKSNQTAKGKTKAIIEGNILALKQEKSAIDQVIASELELDAIQNTPSVAVIPQKGSLNYLTEIRLARVELRALALENVSTTASNEGLRAGFARLKLEMAGLPPVTAANAVGFGALASMSFYLSGALTIVSIKLSELMLKLAPFMPLIMLLVVAFPMLTKALGFGSKVAEKYTQALDKTNEMLDSFREKLMFANETLNNSESSFDAQIDAQLAFGRAIEETSQTLLEQSKAYDDYVRDTSGFVRFFGDFNKKGLAKQTADEITFLSEALMEMESIGETGMGIIGQAVSKEDLNTIKNINAERDILNKKIEESKNEEIRLQRLINAGQALEFDQAGRIIKDNGVARRAEGKEQKSLNKEIENGRKKVNAIILNSLNLVGKETDIFKELTEQQKGSTDALEIANSAIDGAVDSARAFKKQFITKSDVDKPLASFRQITAALAEQNKKGEDTNLTNENRLKLLKRINDDENAIKDLMSEENRIAFEGTSDVAKRQKILEDQEKTFLKARITQIATKNLLEEQKKIQQAIANITKETEAGIEKKFLIQKEERRLQLDLEKTSLSSFLNAARISEEEARRLAILEVNSDLVAEIAKITNKEGEGLTAILKTRALILLELKDEIALKTEDSRKEIDILNLMGKRLKAQEAMNSLVQKNRDLRRKMGEFNETGSTSLRNSRSQEALIRGEEMRLKTAEKRAEIEKALIKAQYAILKAELLVLEEKGKLANVEGFNLGETLDSLTDAESILIGNIDRGLQNSANEFTVALLSGFEKGFKGFNNEISGAAASNTGLAEFIDKITLGETTLSALKANKDKLVAEATEIQQAINNTIKMPVFGAGEDAKTSLLSQYSNDLLKVEDSIKNIDLSITAMGIDLATAALMRFSEQVMKLGGSGEVAASLANFSAGLLQSMQSVGNAFEEKGTKAERFQAVMGALSTVIAGFSAVLEADTKRRIDNIDRAIAAEKRLDGKSAQSVQKIKEMEGKKEQIARKSFETNKKLQIAQAIISTASGAAAALAIPVVGPAVAAMITALGIAQIGLIRKTQYNGTGADMPSANTALNIGSRSSNVDVAQNATGGELNYLRGGSTSGTNLGGAGGAMGRKGYANGGEGIVVGERGPEIITPTEPVDITPNFALGGGTTNVNFSINAVDATGVEDLLVNQRGNIIRMIREAANENGEDFLTQVDPMAYGSNS